jgi:hypothetical protein
VKILKKYPRKINEGKKRKTDASDMTQMKTNFDLIQGSDREKRFVETYIYLSIVLTVTIVNFPNKLRTTAGNGFTDVKILQREIRIV